MLSCFNCILIEADIVFTIESKNSQVSNYLSHYLLKFILINVIGHDGKRTLLPVNNLAVGKCPYQTYLQRWVTMKLINEKSWPFSVG